MGQFETIKLFLMELTGLERDALHIYVALVVFLGSCLIFSWKTRQWKPWMLVLLFAILGEAWDIRETLAQPDPLNLPGNWHDIWNTMLAPTVLMILSRFSIVFAEPTPVSPMSPPEESSGDQP